MGILNDVMRGFGITLLQVAANPYVAILGDPHTAASRLNLTQAFNSLGTTVGPWAGAVLILSTTGVAGSHTTQMPYLVLGGTLFLIAFLFSRFHLPAIPTERPSATSLIGPIQAEVHGSTGI